MMRMRQFLPCLSLAASSLVICSSAFQQPAISAASALSRQQQQQQQGEEGVSLWATGNYLDTLTRPTTGTSSSSSRTSGASSSSTSSYSSPRTSSSSSRTSTTFAPSRQTFEKNNLEVISSPATKFTGPPTPVRHVELTKPANGVTVPPQPTSAVAVNGATAPSYPATATATTTAPEMIIQAPPAGLTYEAYGDVDSQALLAASTFPIGPDALVALAKDAIFTRGLGMNDRAQCLADDFVFRGAHVETSRSDFVRALQSFSLGDSFRVRQQFFGWIVDPIQPNRVWFMNRQEAEQVKEFYGAKPVPGKKLVLPPECLHVDFNVLGQVKEFGFYTVDRAQGNTGGLGGAFGYFYGVGKPLPFPEAKPYHMSKRRRVFETVGKVVNAVQNKWASTKS